jgi:hypothetical protein
MKIFIVALMSVFLSSQAFASSLYCEVKSSIIESESTQIIDNGKAEWSSTTESKTGESFTAHVKVENNLISYIMIGVTDSESGLNRDDKPLSTEAQLSIGDANTIKCSIIL